jgi:hypothetical protein
MVSTLFFSQLVLIALLWLWLMLQWTWPSDRATMHLTPPHPMPPRRPRSRKPHCDACAPPSAPRLHAHIVQPRPVSPAAAR